jgi:hypothetical protein
VRETICGKGFGRRRVKSERKESEDWVKVEWKGRGLSMERGDWTQSGFGGSRAWGGGRRNRVWRRVRVRVRVRDSTVSPPVGNCVGGVSMRSPPTWNGAYPSTYCSALPVQQQYSDFLKTYNLKS